MVKSTMTETVPSWGHFGTPSTATISTMDALLNLVHWARMDWLGFECKMSSEVACKWPVMRSTRHLRVTITGANLSSISDNRASRVAWARPLATHSADVSPWQLPQQQMRSSIDACRPRFGDRQRWPVMGRYELRFILLTSWIRTCGCVDYQPVLFELTRFAMDSICGSRSFYFNIWKYAGILVKKCSWIINELSINVSCILSTVKFIECVDHITMQRRNHVNIWIKI